MKRTRTNDGRFISDKRQKESAVSTGKEVSDEMENKRKENRRRFCRIVYDEIRRLIERGTLDDIETLIPVSGSFLPFLIKAPDHLGWEDAELYCDENMWKEAFVDAFLFEKRSSPKTRLDDFEYAISARKYADYRAIWKGLDVTIGIQEGGENFPLKGKDMADTYPALEWLKRDAHSIAIMDKEYYVTAVDIGIGPQDYVRLAFGEKRIDPPEFISASGSVRCGQ